MIVIILMACVAQLYLVVQVASDTLKSRDNFLSSPRIFVADKYFEAINVFGGVFRYLDPAKQHFIPQR